MSKPAPCRDGEDELDYKGKKQYMSILGVGRYLADDRFDVALAMCKLSMDLARPTVCLWNNI